MKASLVEEHPSHFVMRSHDGKQFRVARFGLSPKTESQIRELGPKKMADGGMARGGAVRGYADGTPEPIMVEPPPPLDDPSAIPERRDPEREKELIRQIKAADADKATASAALANISQSQQQAIRNPDGSEPQGPLEAAVGFAGDPMGAMSRGLTGALTVPGDSTTLKPGIKDAVQSAAHALLPRYASPSGSSLKDAQATIDAAKTKKELGIEEGAGPEASPRAPATAAAAPMPTARAGGIGPDQDLAAIRSGSAEEQSAIKSAYDAEVLANKAKAQGIVAGQQAIDAQRMQSQQLQATARQRADGAMKDLRAKLDDAAKIDTTIDQNHFWASQSTGGKIAGILGLVLGAFGAGKDGINRAAVMMQQNIDRDLETQKAQHEIAIRKGQQAIEGAKSYYAMARESLGDENAAASAAHAAALEDVDRKIELLKTQAADPAAKARLEQLQAAVKQQGAEKTIKGRTELENAYSARLHAEAAAMAAGTKGGANPAEVKDLHTAEATAQDSLDLIRTIRGSLQRSQSMVPGKTAFNENFGDEAPGLGTAATQLTLKLKDMAKLGQISASDQALLDKLLGDPQAAWGRGSSESSKQARLNQLEAIVKRGIQNQRNSVMGAQAQ